MGCLRRLCRGFRKRFYRKQLQTTNLHVSGAAENLGYHPTKEHNKSIDEIQENPKMVSDNGNISLDKRRLKTSSTNNGYEPKCTQYNDVDSGKENEAGSSKENEVTDIVPYLVAEDRFDEILTAHDEKRGALASESQGDIDLGDAEIYPYPSQSELEDSMEIEVILSANSPQSGARKYQGGLYIGEVEDITRSTSKILSSKVTDAEKQELLGSNKVAVPPENETLLQLQEQDKLNEEAATDLDLSMYNNESMQGECDSQTDDSKNARSDSSATQVDPKRGGIASGLLQEKDTSEPKMPKNTNDDNNGVDEEPLLNHGGRRDSQNMNLKSDKTNHIGINPSSYSSDPITDCNDDDDDDDDDLNDDRNDRVDNDNGSNDSAASNDDDSANDDDDDGDDDLNDDCTDRVDNDNGSNDSAASNDDDSANDDDDGDDDLNDDCTDRVDNDDGSNDSVASNDDDSANDDDDEDDSVDDDEDGDDSSNAKTVGDADSSDNADRIDDYDNIGGSDEVDRNDRVGDDSADDVDRIGDDGVGDDGFGDVDHTADSDDGDDDSSDSSDSSNHTDNNEDSENDDESDDDFADDVQGEKYTETDSAEKTDDNSNIDESNANREGAATSEECGDEKDQKLVLNDMQEDSQSDYVNNVKDDCDSIPENEREIKNEESVEEKEIEEEDDVASGMTVQRKRKTETTFWDDTRQSFIQNDIQVTIIP